MENITDLVSELDTECRDNENFHTSLSKKHDQDYSKLNGSISDLSDRLNAHISEDTSASDLAQFKQFALDLIYPVGSVYISFTDKNPGTYLGGQWTKLGGRFLLGADGAYPVNSTGGEARHTLNVNELPAHSHSGATNNAGVHNHTGSTNSTGNHCHNRGDMEIWGNFSTLDAGDIEVPLGAFAHAGGKAQYNAVGQAGKWNDYLVDFRASRNWSGNTSWSGNHAHSLTVNNNGNHSHTFSTNNTGSGQAHNNMPPYLAVHMFRRIS